MNFKFLRKYVKELKNFPIKHLFEPWKAPLNVQEDADCIIGKDYPEPIVDHESAFLENNLKLRQYFQVDNREIYDSFLNNKDVIRPANKKEYNFFTYEHFLRSKR